MKRATRTIVVSLGVASLGGAGVLVTAMGDPRRALLAWLAAYGFGLSTAIGALFLVMIFHVTHARWPLAVRPLLMAVVGTLPLFVLLFVPIALGIRSIYPWAHEVPGLPEELEVALAHQRTWNEPSFFLGRAVVYLAVWSVLAIALGTGDEVRHRRVSAAGIIVLAFTLTFASFDWLMSIEPGWVSNMYGVYVFAGGLSAAISLAAVLAWRSRRIGRLPDAVGPSHFHALGRLLLMAVVLWAYIAFFQLMLVWIGDLPREVTFFVARSRGSYVALDVLLVFGHFVLPLLALLSRPLKREGALLAIVSVWVLLMNAVDFAWLVLPSGGEHLHLLDAAPFLTVTGLGVAYGTWRFHLGGRALDAAALTERATVDPALADSLRYRSS